MSEVFRCPSFLRLKDLSCEVVENSVFRCSPLDVSPSASAEVFGSVLVGLSERQLDPGIHCLGLNLAPAKEPQHTTHTQRRTEAQAHTRTHIHTRTSVAVVVVGWGGGGGAAAAADGETILATLKHGSRTRLLVLKPVGHLSKDRVESSHEFEQRGTSVSVSCIILACVCVCLSEHYTIIDHVVF